MKGIEDRIEAAFEDRGLLKEEEYRSAVFDTVAALDRGELRVAQESGGEWRSNAWVMKAINLYFAVAEMQTIEVGPFEYHDKIPTKKDLAASGVRVVPPGTVRYGAFVEPWRCCYAWLRQHRGVRRERDDGRHVGHGRLGGPDRTRRAPCRGCWHRGCARTCQGRCPS